MAGEEKSTRGIKIQLDSVCLAIRLYYYYSAFYWHTSDSDTIQIERNGKLTLNYCLGGGGLKTEIRFYRSEEEDTYS